MSRNTVIVLVSIFLVFVLGVTFIVCSVKMIQLRNQKSSVEPIIDYAIEEKPSNTSDIQITKYLNFTVYREDNTEVNLSEYENNPVMILFFNDKDSDSLEVLGEVDSLYETYKDTVKFLMVNTNREVNPELKDKYKLEIFYDFYKEAVRNYNITEFPAMIYITEENTILNAKVGIPSVDSIDANLEIISNNY